MMLGGATETNSYTSERSGGAQAPCESASADISGLLSWPLLMRTRNKALGTCGRKETCALGAPGMGCRKRGERGVLSEEPPNPDVGNGSSDHPH